MQTYLACFDITDDRTRYRVGKLLGSYGDRVQKSVYEVRFKRTTQMHRVRTEIQQILDEDDDCRFYSICQNCRRKSLDGSGDPVAVFPSIIVV